MTGNINALALRRKTRQARRLVLSEKRQARLLVAVGIGGDAVLLSALLGAHGPLCRTGDLSIAVRHLCPWRGDGRDARLPHRSCSFRGQVRWAAASARVATAVVARIRVSGVAP